MAGLTRVWLQINTTIQGCTLDQETDVSKPEQRKCWPKQEELEI